MDKLQAAVEKAGARVAARVDHAAAKTVGIDLFPNQVLIFGNPTSPEDWQRLRNAFFQRLRREGTIRCHWVVEWQQRRVPHLHLAIWSEQPDFAQVLLAH